MMGAKRGRVYVFDTSAIIAAWSETYPHDVFPKFWDRLDELVDAGRLIAPVEVLHELGKVEDDAHEWLKQRSEKVLMDLTDAVQRKVVEVLGRYQKLTAIGGNRGKADPFVVALAIVEGGTVVTKERHGPSPKNPKIPDACDGFSVPCFTLLQMIREEKWRFGG